MPRQTASTNSLEKEPLLLNEFRESTQRAKPNEIRIYVTDFADHEHQPEMLPIETELGIRNSSHNLPVNSKEIYHLSNEGKIDITDPEWTEKLQRAIQASDISLVEALLCCGVPMTRELIENIPRQQKEMYKFCSKFFPDIWTAVKVGNVKQVRCLVNLWHKVDLCRNGKSLFQLAIEHSNPYVIALIGGIQNTMEVAHFVLAGDVDKLRSVRKNGSFIKRTLKHFGHDCAPILYFAIMHNDFDMVNELCSYFGMKADEEMVSDEGDEIPLLFIALKMQLDVRIFQVLLTHTSKELHNIWYHTKNILQYAVDIKVTQERFQLLLSFGGERLMAERDLLGSTPYDVVSHGDCNGDLFHMYKSTMEDQIRMWVKDCDDNSGWLAVMGFSFDEGLHCESSEEIERVQELITSLDGCIVNDDSVWFDKLCCSDISFKRWPNPIWLGHPVGCGQTLLHRAVLFNRKEIVESILTHANMTDIPLDNFGASALHYACASTEYEELERILLCTGFGEHYIDKRGNDCASYRMKRSSPEMTVYLTSILEGNAEKSVKLDPWKSVSPSSMHDHLSLGQNNFHGNGNTCFHHKSTEVLERSKDPSAYGVQPDTWCSIS